MYIKHNSLVVLFGHSRGLNICSVIDIYPSLDFYTGGVGLEPSGFV